ncbi:MAG: hypothetical protein MUF49_23945 [Oculatellaceae cyanobacterium Prado106]|nr:hypothetical protein [Oculatellaceae cyanobacterium Prado106]
MTTEVQPNPFANYCPPNPCVYSIPIRLKVPIYIDIKTMATSQPVPPQLVMVPIQPNLQLTPKVESRQPECVMTDQCAN